ARLDDYFRRPTRCRPRGAGVPNAVPVKGDTVRGGNQPVDAGPGCVDLEKISRAPVSIGVEHNADGVITCQIAVASHGVDGDVAGIRIFTCTTKIDPVAGDDDLDLSFIS